MNQNGKNKYDIKYTNRSKILKAIAHPTRLFIIDKLTEKEHCVCELTEMVGDDISTISKHLSVLREAGIVSNEKRGNMVYYKLMCPCIMSFLFCVDRVIKNNKEDNY